MNKEEIKYFMLSFQLLKEWLPFNQNEMLMWYEDHPDDFTIEHNDYIYFLFSYPVLADRQLERCILLVYDDQTVIADMSGFMGQMNEICFDEQTIQYLRDDSGWMDIEQYILEQLYGNDPDIDESPAFLLSSAYVTRSYRRKHIFTIMEAMMHDFVLQNTEGTIVYYSIVSLDQDIACYGPDASDKPYYYSFEKDEPARQINRQIIEKLGYKALRLEADKVGDGTMLWFAVKKEEDFVLEEPA